MTRSPHLPTAAAALLATGALVTLLAVVVPGQHLPTGDGAHILAAAWRIGASAAPIDDLLHRITPHPPLAYAPSALLVPWLGVRATLAAQALLSTALAFVGIRWLRPSAHPADHLTALAVLLSSGIVWWATDQHALDWLSTALVLAALGAVLRATASAKAAVPIAAIALLAAILTKYTAAFALVGGIGMALALGAWRKRTTWIIAGVVVVVGLAWTARAYADLTAYSATTLSEAGAGGPGGAINRDPNISFADRLAPARLLLWLQALRDCFGWLPLAALAGSLAWTRLATPGARIAAAAAAVPLLTFPLMRIQPQPRYLLPSAALLLVAALPRHDRPRARVFTVAAGILALVATIYSAALYRGLPPADRPGHRATTPTAGLGDWPWPAAPTWPTRSPVEQWGTADALAAVHAQLPEGGSGALVRFGFDPDRPSWAAIDLVARQHGIQREWVVAESPRGPLHAAPGMPEPTWAWVSWTDESARPALAWVQDHADLEGAITWWSEDGTGGVVLPLGAHQH